MLDLFIGSFRECQRWYDYIAVGGLWILVLLLIFAVIGLIGFLFFYLSSTFGVLGFLVGLIIIFWFICCVLWWRNDV